ncbi:MAG TPA: DUF5715 family protein [Longimicrobiales bacterium]|nr:DUF5715 family protein [Longimicrobiales bacterium]
MRRLLLTGLMALTSGALATAAEAREPSLRGSPASMQEQNRVAQAHGLTFYRTSGEIHAAVDRGELIPLEGNEDYDVADFVSHPYAHPAAVLFVERLSAQYRSACDQKLVVTSAVRPSNSQPRNAHRLSVHPAGMALDLRVSDRQPCRAWLEGALMNLEREGVLNGIRERNPPHYHVALYPEQYLAYVAPMIAAEEAARAEAEARAAAEREAAEAAAAAAAAAAPRIVQGSAGTPSLPAAPVMATLALLAVLPLSRLALRRGWLRRIVGEAASGENEVVMAPEAETR